MRLVIRETARADAYREVFTWLLGESDDFPQREGAGTFYWRKPLREKLKQIEDKPNE
jgi:hypothetical protein